MVQKKDKGKENFPFSKGRLSLIAVILGFLLLLLFIWLWYDVKLKALNYEKKAVPQNSSIQLPQEVLQKNWPRLVFEKTKSNKLN